MRGVSLIGGPYQYRDIAWRSAPPQPHQLQISWVASTGMQNTLRWLDGHPKYFRLTDLKSKIFWAGETRMQNTSGSSNASMANQRLSFGNPKAVAEVWRKHLHALRPKLGYVTWSSALSVYKLANSLTPSLFSLVFSSIYTLVVSSSCRLVSAVIVPRKHTYLDSLSFSSRRSVFEPIIHMNVYVLIMWFWSFITSIFFGYFCKLFNPQTVSNSSKALYVP